MMNNYKIAKNAYNQCISHPKFAHYHLPKIFSDKLLVSSRQLARSLSVFSFFANRQAIESDLRGSPQKQMFFSQKKSDENSESKSLNK